MSVPGAYTFKNWMLTIDGEDVSNQVSKVNLKPDQAVATYKTATPGGIIQDVADPVYTLELTGVQNNTPSTGLAAILRANSGTTVQAVYVPDKTDGAVQATFDIVCLEMPLGGETDAWNTADVTLPVSGAVTWGSYSA
jgi:hypothetical protein